MKLQHVIEQVYSQPWCITPQAHAAIRALVENKLSGIDAKDFESERGGKDNAPQIEMRGDTVILPIAGTIIPRASILERTCGCIGCVDIGAMIDQAQSNKARTIVFDFDSPGGSVTAIAETASRIAALSERTIAFSAGQMASAAFWLGCSCDEVIATPTATLGSIGIFNATLDRTAAYAASGLKVELFKSGDLKGAGFPGTALSDEQRTHLQAQVDTLFEMFRSHVTAQRPRVGAEAFRGQSLFGAQAQQLGLVDMLVNSLDELLASLSTTPGTRSVARPADEPRSYLNGPTTKAFLLPPEDRLDRALVSRHRGRHLVGQMIDGKVTFS